MKEFFKNINPFNRIEPTNKWLYLLKVVLKFAVVYLSNIFLIALLLWLIGIVGGDNLFKRENVHNETLKFVVYYAHAFSIILTIILVRFVDKKPLSSVGLTKKGIWQVSLGVLYALVSASLVVFVLIVTKQYKFNGLNPDRNYKKILFILGAFITYALAEELLCRGVIESRLNEKFNIHVCVFVAFLVFCIPHVIELFSYSPKYSVVAILNFFIISYIFSLLLDVYKNIYVCCGFHAMWNVLFCSVIGSNINGVDSHSAIFSFSFNGNVLNGGDYGVECGLITGIVLAVFCVVLAVTLKIVHKKEKIKILTNPIKSEKTDL